MLVETSESIRRAVGIRREWFDGSEQVLDLGVGNRKRGTVGLDIAPTSAADVVADARDLPFASDSFDAVICYHLIEHLTPIEVDDLLSSASRVIRPGGRLYLLVDRDVSRDRLLDKDPTHFERYDPESVRAAVNRHFEIAVFQTHNLVGNVLNHPLSWPWMLGRETKVYIEGVAE